MACAHCRGGCGSAGQARRSDAARACRTAPAAERGAQGGLNALPMEEPMRAKYSVIAVAALGAALSRPGAITAGGSGPTVADTAATIDQDAMSALDDMGKYLRTLTAFQVRAAITSEEVLLDGEKVQFAN